MIYSLMLELLAVSIAIIGILLAAVALMLWHHTWRVERRDRIRRMLQ